MLKLSEVACHFHRRQWPITIAVIVTLFYYFFLGWNSAPPLITDSYGYFSMADSLFFGQSADTMPFSKSLFPPLYPLILALLGGGKNMFAAHMITSLLFAAAIILSFVWIRKNGLAAAPSVFILATMAISPAIINQSFHIMSESLYMTLCLLSLIFLRQDSRDHHQHILLAAFCCSLAMLTRTVAIALVVPFVFYLLYYKIPRRYHAIAVIALPNLVWVVYKNVFFPRYNYLSGLIKYWSGSDWGALFIMPFKNAGSLWSAWTQMFFHFHSVLLNILVGFAAILLLLGMITRLKQFKVDAWYVLLYLGIVLIWPFPAESVRFITVIFPFLLFYMVQGLELLIPKRAVTRINYPLSLTALLFLLCLPSFLQLNTRLSIRVDPELTTYKKSSPWLNAPNPDEARFAAEAYHRLIVAVKALPQYLPADHCVYHSIPPLVSYFSGHTVKDIPLYDKPKLTEKDFPECNYMLISTIAPMHTGYPGMYPIWSLARTDIETVFASQMGDGKVVVILLEFKRHTATKEDITTSRNP